MFSLLDDARNYILRSPFPCIHLTKMKEQKVVIKAWERKNFIISPNYDGSKTISAVINANNSNFEKKSDQKLEFLFESFLPTNVIVCDQKDSFEKKDEKENITEPIN